MLWEIAGTPHRLLGSSHVLPKEIVFPSWVAASYEGIERFVFESGGNESPREIGIDRTQAHLKFPRALEVYQSAKTLLESIKIYDSFDDLLPWAAAFHVVGHFLPILGISPIYGVDFQLRKIAENKRLVINFLESSNHSSELIDLACKKSDGGLNFFEQTVADFRSDECRVMLRRLIKSWVSSDLADFNAIRDEHLIKFPSVFYPIITQRNREFQLPPRDCRVYPIAEIVRGI